MFHPFSFSYSLLSLMHLQTVEQLIDSVFAVILSPLLAAHSSSDVGFASGWQPETQLTPTPTARLCSARLPYFLQVCEVPVLLQSFSWR